MALNCLTLIAEKRSFVVMRRLTCDLSKEGTIIIWGPGQAEMAHQTDEFCYSAKIEETVKMHKNISLKYGETIL